MLERALVILAMYVRDLNIPYKVFMCKENATGDILALKMLKKKVIIEDDESRC